MFKKIIIIIIIIILVLTGIGFWFYQNYFNTTKNKNENITTEDFYKNICKEKFEGEERSAPPKGFLIPGPNSIPAQFTLSFSCFTNNASHYHYITEKNIASEVLNITEQNDKTYEDTIKINLAKSKFEDIRAEKEFEFQGSKGMVIASYYPIGSNQITPERWLYYDHSGRLLSLHTTNQDFSSADNLINLLKTLQPAP